MIIKIKFMSEIIQTYFNTFKRATYRKKKKKIHKLKLLKTFFFSTHYNILIST